MKKNIGTPDRVLRFIGAVLILGFAWWQSSWLALALGLFVLYEAFAGWCAMYQLLGINRCKNGECKIDPPKDEKKDQNP